MPHCGPHCSPPFSGPLAPLKGSESQQHQHHLGAGWRCKQPGLGSVSDALGKLGGVFPPRNIAGCVGLGEGTGLSAPTYLPARCQPAALRAVRRVKLSEGLFLRPPPSSRLSKFSVGYLSSQQGASSHPAERVELRAARPQIFLVSS